MQPPACVCAGILLYSILLIEQQQDLAAGALFALLLNLKHLFAYLAPIYFVYLLRHYCMGAGEQQQQQQHSSTSSSSRGKGRSMGAGEEQQQYSITSSSSSSSGGGPLSPAAGLLRLVKLGSIVLIIFGISFGPFVAMGQLGQVGEMGEREEGLPWDLGLGAWQTGMGDVWVSNLKVQVCNELACTDTQSHAVFPGSRP